MDPIAKVIARESGLKRDLSERQLAMIAIGGAIGTGLFLGSSISVQLAGPSVIVSYALGAVVALLLMGALSEMAAAHPSAGSFGLYAEIFLNPWAGWVVRYTYWFAQTLAIGEEVIAAGTYAQYWFPKISLWVWVLAFSALMVYVNARSVGSYGEFEYWFAMIKVAAIMVFILFGAALLAGFHSQSGIEGFAAYTKYGGFFPNGLRGVWLAMGMVLFSYLGLEVVAVTSGEAKKPEEAVPRAMRSTLVRLFLFYVAAIAVLVAIVPWNGVSLQKSPFVKVFESIGIPAASSIMNFVVLTAALSSVNCNLYLTTRMLFSLSRGGYAPEALGKLSSRGVPSRALVASTGGMIASVIVAHFFPRDAFVYVVGVAIFGGLFVWMMIFVTHLNFRKKISTDTPRPVQMPLYPFTSWAGLLLLVAITITTWWIPQMKITLISGAAWLAFISVCYFTWKKKNRSKEFAR